MTSIPKTAVAVAALAAIASFAPAAHAASEPSGALCGLTAVSEAYGVLDQQPTAYGELDAGPVDVGSGTAVVTCAVQYGGHHADDDAASASAPGAGVVVLAPRTVRYPSYPGQDVYLCTRLAFDGGTTLYFDAATGGWSTDPEAATCTLTTPLRVDRVTVRVARERRA